MNLKGLLIQETRTNRLDNKNARAPVAPKPNADGSSAIERFAPPVS
jgi:hypothetical protein